MHTAGLLHTGLHLHYHSNNKEKCFYQPGTKSSSTSGGSGTAAGDTKTHRLKHTHTHTECNQMGVVLIISKQEVCEHTGNEHQVETDQETNREQT